MSYKPSVSIIDGSRWKSYFEQFYIIEVVKETFKNLRGYIELEYTVHGAFANCWSGPNGDWVIIGPHPMTHIEKGELREILPFLENWSSKYHFYGKFN